MRHLFFFGVLLFVCLDASSQRNLNAPTEIFRLAPPQLKATSIFFDTETSLALSYDFPDALIRYTLNGDEVVKNSKVYVSPIPIFESSIITAKVFHADYLESEPVRVVVLKAVKDALIKNLNLTPSADEQYRGLGPKGLWDMVKGGKQFATDPQWMGFQTDSIKAVVKLGDKSKVSTVVVSSLVNQSSWIFAPAEIKVFYLGKLIGETTYPESSLPTVASDAFNKVSVTPGVYDQLEVVIYPLKVLPEWHQGKGTQPWFFMDEIILQN